MKRLVNYNVYQYTIPAYMYVSTACLQLPKKKKKKPCPFHSPSLKIAEDWPPQDVEPNLNLTYATNYNFNRPGKRIS